MGTSFRVALLSLAVAFVPGLSLSAAEKAATPASHQEIGEIKVKTTDGKYGVQTMCVDDQGQVLALAAPPRSYGAALKDAVSEIHVFDAAGKALRSWKVEFHAHSLNAGPDGIVYVAGDGKVAKFDKDGKKLVQIDLPHIASLLKDTGEMRKRAEEQIKQQKESFANSVKQIKTLKEKLEAKKPADRTPQEEKQIQQYEQILKSYEQSTKYYESQTVEAVLAQTTGRLRIINGITLSEKDIFIACGESKGYGYAIWRMDHDFKNARQILSAIGGCCGQMDIQCCGVDLLVAENTKHRFAKYDRDGKPVGAWGKRAAANDTEGFGGCCNPMNLRCCGSDIFTAESEGIIKRFSAKGDYLGEVGRATLKGGCKNVAVGAAPNGERVYLCDQPGSRIIILGLKKAEK